MSDQEVTTHGSSSDDVESDLSQNTSEESLSNSEDEEFNKKFFVTMKMLSNGDTEKLKKLRENVLDTDQVTSENKKLQKKSLKPLYIRDYQLKLLLNNQLDASSDADAQNEPQIPDEEKFAYKDREIINAIHEKTTHESPTEDFFVEMPPSTLTNVDIDNKINSTNESNLLNLDFVQDYVLNKRYHILDAHEPGQKENPGLATSKDDILRIMNISYPRRIDSSRLPARKRAEKKKKYLENKLKRKKQLSEKLRNEKAAKKREILETIGEISGNSYPHADTRVDLASTAVEEDETFCEENDGLSKREMKKLRRMEKSKKRRVRHELDPQHLRPDLVDQYYQMDYEDVIDDTPVRYSYRQVTPNSYGLTPEQILLCDNKELNKWCSIRKVLRHTDPDEERNITQTYKRKVKNPKIRSRLLRSLFWQSHISSNVISETTLAKGTKSSVPRNKNRLMTRYFKHANPSLVQKLPIQRLLAYNLNSVSKFKGKRKNHASEK